ncbi:TonB-dependent receptor [Novosphingobium flavum]|uniref:TonB-dependent receptor n=1 Tax=Novosphingobium flavum TaxID=1778672 RepID=A0A7X1FRC0_9SPHN|nr:TonB-dependent receptor [Novosphingobium flavum]MBC2665513.1 TonB-dependent receptor [Novosphingobium flavum]
MIGSSKSRRARWIAGTALFVFQAAVGAQVALAQAADAVDEKPSEDIIVTGSRLVTNGDSSPTPLTVASVDQMLTAQPAGVIEGLNSLPGLLGSINTTSNVNTGGFNTLNLRGIGTIRGLVLVDGHRVGSTQNGGAVDVDVIPQILLKRVEVVTGGASAAYGSDAVSGVVNFITDTKFTGLKLDARAGISDYGDDRKIGLGAGWGADFNEGRGHVIASFEYVDNAGFKRADRPFLNNYGSMVGSVAGSTASPGSAANPWGVVYGGTLNSVTFGGLINNGPLINLQFTPTGTLTTFNAGTPTGTGAVNAGGDGAYFKGSTAGAAQSLYRAMARVDYDITDDIHFHTSGILTKYKQNYSQQNPQFSKILIAYSNPFLASVQQPYQATIAAQPAGNTFQLSKMELGLPIFSYNAFETYYNVDAGLDGTIGGFKWQADYYRTESRFTRRNNAGVNLNRFYASINAVNSGGNIVCNAALTNPTFSNCAPYNIFNASDPRNAAAIAYFVQPNINTQHYVTNDFNADINGELFNLPAGPVKMALVGEWRRTSLDIQSNASPTDPIDCNGIQYNCVNSVNAARWLGRGDGVPMATRSVSVTELATEVEVPLLKDVPLIKSLTLNGAARYTNYSTSGVVWTWKGGVVWNVSDDLTLRGTRSRDIRAPTLDDLYAPTTISLTSYSDILTGGSNPNMPQQSQGNPNLKPEKADTLTFGAVFKPRFIPGFSFAVDYYKIKINQAIVGIAAFQPATWQACLDAGQVGPVCDLYVRPFAFGTPQYATSANFPTLIKSQSLNVASLSTHGIDFELNYANRIGDRPFSLRALVTYQPTLKYDNGPLGVVDVGGAADGVGGLPPIAKWKVVADAKFDPIDSLHISVRERWRAALRQNGTASIQFAIPNIPAVGYTDLNIGYDIKPGISAYLNIQNLFNTKPPFFASTGGATQMNYLGGFAQGDDIEGRYFTVGVRAKF